MTLAVLIVMGSYLPMANILWLIFYSGVALAIYFGILVLFKEFTRKDLKYFMELLNLGAMIHYIRDEIRNEERGKI